MTDWSQLVLGALSGTVIAAVVGGIVTLIVNRHKPRIETETASVEMAIRNAEQAMSFSEAVSAALEKANVKIAQLEQKDAERDAELAALRREKDEEIAALRAENKTLRIQMADLVAQVAEHGRTVTD